MIFLFALSIRSEFKDERYILVVFSDLCPIPSLITERGIIFCLAAFAHVCRATYIVNGAASPSLSPKVFNA